ncbi:hypothetical protein MLD38_033327 [Melastoma candidum]|uniref:Uncharacterized protein n=1 Tax=Melastoma candidum TaxID=119954 RepID=A0ACB9M6I8_9MYRT|nr:hypothetical protein MLD38_033327 [Melastoma candidum]
MDAKSLAKSKRSHSRNLNRRHNPNPKSNPHSSQSADAANPGTAKKKPPRRNSGAVPGLPTNWDRYEDEEQTELGEGVSVGAGGTSTGKSSVSGKVEASDVPVPKSKGADYRYLVEEAKSQRQYLIRGDSSSDAVFSLDDTIPGTFMLLNLCH